MVDLWHPGRQFQHPSQNDRALVSGRSVSISPAAWFVKVRAFRFSLSNLRKPLASIHKRRLSHLSSLARVKQQTPPPYQAIPILIPAPNMGFSKKRFPSSGSMSKQSLIGSLSERPKMFGWRFSNKSSPRRTPGLGQTVEAWQTLQPTENVVFHWEVSGNHSTWQLCLPHLSFFGSFNKAVKNFKGVFFFPLEFNNIQQCCFLIPLWATNHGERISNQHVKFGITSQFP